MKNIGIAIAAVIVIVILAAGGFLFLKHSKAPAMPKPTVMAKPTAMPSKTSSVTGTIMGLIAGGKTVSCTITYPNNKGTGTVFVNGKKFAGDFNVEDSAGKAIVAHIVSDGAYLYLWSSSMPSGIKMSLLAAKNAATNAQNNSQTVDVNQNVSMDCQPWITVDTTKFTVPTTIKFTDMSKFFPAAQPSTAVTPAGGTGTANTSVCDQITDPTAKAACIKAMNSQ